MLKNKLMYGDWEITQNYPKGTIGAYFYQHKEFTGDDDIRTGDSKWISTAVEAIDDFEYEMFADAQNEINAAESK